MLGIPLYGCYDLGVADGYHHPVDWVEYAAFSVFRYNHEIQCVGRYKIVLEGQQLFARAVDDAIFAVSLDTEHLFVFLGRGEGNVFCSVQSRNGFAFSVLDFKDAFVVLAYPVTRRFVALEFLVTRADSLAVAVDKCPCVTLCES